MPNNKEQGTRNVEHRISKGMLNSNADADLVTKFGQEPAFGDLRRMLQGISKNEY
jgi:hypothetical protein